jgi:hypothetical protein
MKKELEYADYKNKEKMNELKVPTHFTEFLNIDLNIMYFIYIMNE